MKRIVIFILFITSSMFSQYPGRDTYSHNLMWNEFHPATKDSIRANAVDTVITVIYPIPIDSLVDSTITVSADSGLGGGGTTNLGDTVNIRVHVDSVTIDIFQDTLRADTTKLATRIFVNDTSKQIASDTAQYYYWRAKSRYRFPQYDDMVLWDYNDFQTTQDSMFVCYFVEYATNRNYLQAYRDTSATDSQYVHLHWTFVAPRGVSDITDTLFIIRYKTTATDTSLIGIKPIITEVTTTRYEQTDLVANTNWDSLVVRKTYGTLSSIVTGDQFSLDLRIKSAGDTCYVEMVEERWY